MKVILEYDNSTGEIKDASGINVGNYFGLNHYGLVEDTNELSNRPSIGEIAKMKDAGFTVDEIIQLKNNRLI